MSSYDDDPSDFYSYIHSLVVKYMENEVSKLSNKNEESSTKIDSYNRLVKLGLTRSLVKIVVMRESYSASIPTLTNNLLLHDDITQHGKEAYYTYNNKDIRFYKRDIVLYVMSLKYVIKSIAPKIDKLSKYLDGIVSICTNLKIPIP